MPGRKVSAIARRRYQSKEVDNAACCDRMRQEYSAGSTGFILGSLPRCKKKCHQTRSYMGWGLLRIPFVRSIQPWKQTKTGTEVPSLTFLRRILKPHPHVPHVQDRPRHQPHRPLRMRRGGGEEIQTAFSTDLIAPGVPPYSLCQSRRRATEQRETSQTAGQRRPEGGLRTEGRRVWRGGAGGTS